MADALDARISEMEAEGVDRYDPVRFRYIRSLIMRARGKPAPVAAAIRQKASAMLTAYATDLDRARTEAELLMAHVSTAFPDDAPVIRRLFDDHQFKRVCRFGRQGSHRRPKSGLSALTDRIGESGQGSSENVTRPGLDALLRQQEQQATAPADDGRLDRDMTAQPHSFPDFREIMVKLYTDRLVTRAFEDLPENPGPLNAQMLATRSLMALRRISPDYLSRFVAYIDTLVRLQQAAEDDPDARKPKKKT